MSDETIFDDINSFLRSAPPEPDSAEPKIALMSNEEIDTLILSFAEGRGLHGFSENEVANLIYWAEKTILNQNLLNMILKGLILISSENNAPLERSGDNMTYKLTKFGEDAFNKLDND